MRFLAGYYLAVSFFSHHIIETSGGWRGDNMINSEILLHFSISMLCFLRETCLYRFNHLLCIFTFRIEIHYLDIKSHDIGTFEFFRKLRNSENILECGIDIHYK